MGCTLSIYTDQSGVIRALQDYGVYSDNTEVNTSTVTGQIEAYTKCAPVQDAINMIASYHSSLRIAAVDDKGNWLGGDKGTAEQKRIIASDLKKLKQFNPREGFIRFQHRVKTYLSIFGVCYVHKQPIIGFPGMYDYYIIPNNIITPEYIESYSYNGNYERKIKRYRLNLNAENLYLQPEEVFTFIDRVAGFQNVNTGGLNVTSRMVALREPVSTLLSMGQMLTQLLADGGARGIITQETSDPMSNSPFLDAEKVAIQDELKKYGHLRSQYKYIVTRSAANYIPLTAKIVDMQLPEIALAKKIDVYRAYGIPTAFAVNESRFKVLPEARKELFTSTVIPEGEDLFSDMLKLVGIPERAWQYVPDWSHMDFFQESLKESAIALQQAGNGLVPLVDSGIISSDEANSYLEPYIK